MFMYIYIYIHMYMPRRIYIHVCAFIHRHTNMCAYNIDPQESWTCTAGFKCRGFTGRPGSHCGCPEAFKKRKKCGLKQQPLPELEFPSGFGPDQPSTISCVPVSDTSKIWRVVIFARHYQTLQHTTRHCNTLPDTAKHYQTLQHTTRHCNTLPPCITLVISCVSGTSKIWRVVMFARHCQTLCRNATH